MIDYDFDRLAMPNEDVLKLSDEQRIHRLENLIKESHLILDYGISKYVTPFNQGIAAKCVLFSGGNDSTALVYLFKDIVDYVIHINTGIGIEETRQFVRDTCEKLNLVLKEYHPKEENKYENLIKQFGFPGPAQHFLMYQRLKERSLFAARKELNPKFRRNRIIYIAGRRRDESNRRMNIPLINRFGSIVWVSPLYNWTKTDIETFRKINPEIPRNLVSDLIHMSGECLCGAFAHKGEREEIRFFFPEVVDYIESLEKSVKEMNTHTEQRCEWGWGSHYTKKKSKKVGELCSSCESSDSPQFETEKSPHKGQSQFVTVKAPHKGHKHV